MSPSTCAVEQSCTLRARIEPTTLPRTMTVFGHDVAGHKRFLADGQRAGGDVAFYFAIDLECRQQLTASPLTLMSPLMIDGAEREGACRIELCDAATSDEPSLVFVNISSSLKETFCVLYATRRTRLHSEGVVPCCGRTIP